jgi:type III secretory pathway component EscV
VSVGDADQLAAAGIEVWRDPMQFVIRELERQLRRHLDAFLTVDEVSVLHERWKSAFADAAPPEVSPVRLTVLVRWLAREQVPLINGAALLTAAAQPGPIEEIADAYRLAVAPALLGNEVDTVRVAVPPLLASLAARPSRAGEAEAEELLAALAELRGTLADIPERAALVAVNGAARRAVRDYTAVEYPDIPVLSAPEAGKRTVLDRAPERPGAQ